MPTHLVVHTDGAARGNPGPAGIGIVVADRDGHVLRQDGRFLGSATNNQAEYHALIAALEIVGEYQPQHVDLFLDSELVVYQLRGTYRVRDAKLRRLYERCRALMARLPNVAAHHVPRARNSEADRLANEAIDRALSGKVDGE